MAWRHRYFVVGPDVISRKFLLMSETPWIFGTNWIRKRKRYEKAYRRRNHAFCILSYLKESLRWRSKIISESKPLFCNLLIQNRVPIIRAHISHLLLTFCDSCIHFIFYVWYGNASNIIGMPSRIVPRLYLSLVYRIKYITEIPVLISFRYFRSHKLILF